MTVRGRDSMAMLGMDIAVYVAILYECPDCSLYITRSMSRKRTGAHSPGAQGPGPVGPEDEAGPKLLSCQSLCLDWDTVQTHPFSAVSVSWRSLLGVLVVSGSFWVVLRQV